MTAHYLPRSLPEAASAYIDSMPPGHVELFSLTPLDRTGIPVWNVIFLPSNGRKFTAETPHGVGYGSSDDEAIVGATGELAEAVHSARGFAELQVRTGSFTSLRARLGARGVIDPLTLCLPAGSAVNDETVMDWVPAQRWPTGESVLVPIEMAACASGDLQPDYAPFTTPITNGLGAGPTLDFAIGHGLGELLQRDGNGLGFRAMDRGIVLDFAADEPRDPRTRALLSLFTSAGIEVLPKFASDEFGVANLYVVGGEPDASAPFPLMVTACGEAASLDREHALRKALLEFGSSRARKAFSHAPLAQIAHVAPPGYLERFRAYHTLVSEEGRALRAMKAWCLSDAATLRANLADTVLSRQGIKAFGELPDWSGSQSGEASAQELARRLTDRGLEVLVLDFSPPGGRVHVAKVIVPGLEVETMSYHRIGERGFRLLQSRDSPLVGTGAMPAGALPVRLPADAAARIGGTPWLNVAEVDRLVGTLYPLYREPLVHSAPIALEAA